MNLKENYIDDVFKVHLYKENIKKYVYKEIDDLNFDVNKINYIMSNDSNVYSNLLYIYFNNKEYSDSLLRLFKVISLHKIENIYIFEILIINILSGLTFKEAMFKCVSLNRINTFNKEYQKHFYDFNPVSNEVMNAKMNIIMYFYYARKYLKKDTEAYIESICNAAVDDIIDEYNDNILIALMAISIKIYYGDYLKIDKLLEYTTKVNYLDSMLSLFIVLDKSENINERFIELFNENLVNKNNDLIINFAYLIRLFFFN